LEVQGEYMWLIHHIDVCLGALIYCSSSDITPRYHSKL